MKCKSHFADMFLRNIDATILKMSLYVVVVVAFLLCRTFGVDAYDNLTLATQQRLPTPLPSRSSDFTKGRICIGTNGRMSVGSNREHHYQNLRDRYTNCTFVDGNLEITWLSDENMDLSFLQHIREVTGYVLISHVNVKHVVLPSLQIIRGRTLFKLSVHGDFALAVTLSKMDTLQLPALRAILNGNVGIFNNFSLCHIRTIEWTEILDGKGALPVYQYNFTEPERQCECDKSCEGGCWGPGPENCQKFSKINCSPQCEQGRCFGPEPRQCCNLFCAGGCTGPKQSDCLACRNFYDDGECKEECPPMQRYNPTSYSWEPNPDGKYAYGATCVKKCPKHLFKDNGACVRSCPPNKKVENQECVPCDGPCPRQCKADDDVIHSGNIDSFEGCTMIQGSIRIMDHSFNGFRPLEKEGSALLGEPHPPMHPDRLEVFSSLKRVTGFITIQANHSDFKNLSYFRNLEEIKGVDTTEYSSSLYIIKTSLEFLGLRSLKTIMEGKVAILENDNLCLADTVDWSSIKRSPYAALLKNNAPPEKCRRAGLVCHEQCSDEGCWGPTADQCVACRNFKSEQNCVAACNSEEGLYEAEGKVCARCHVQCKERCHGPGAGNCTECLHVKDGPYCVAECPSSKYDDSGVCKDCHANCEGGCQGPEPYLGPRGCHSCQRGVIDVRDNFTAVYCLPKDAQCPEGYFSEYVGEREDNELLKNMSGKYVCRKCHERCQKCTGYGFHVSVCSECTYVKKGEQCEVECPHDHYEDKTRKECLPCHEECRVCHGPLSSDCSFCYNYRLYMDDEDYHEDNSTQKFNCTASCPDGHPHKIFPKDSGDPYCARNAFSELAHANMPAILGCVMGVLFLLFAVTVVQLYKRYNKAKFKADVVKMTTQIPGVEGPLDEMVKQPTIGPNLAQLRTVKEAELRKGDMLGYGAFGSVYKGVWVPEGENVKIPVAIKVLHDGAGHDSGRAFLDEAKIMASVEHPNLLQLLAVCMTSQMMLVTQLMPLGCLLTYVRDNKDRIGSKAMLSWCTQIARGMAYLEDKRLVHRDLAARNVLVQTPQHVKITDFGLAKLLEINEEAYKAVGGKMPIKWLAMECITHRIFTHKSDVWAFGVTVWEILTYGAKPYENIPAWEVAEFLQKGERLQQPPIASLDVYMIMIKCWILSPDDRPTFRELADEFAKMSRDPGRYLAIKGDRLMRLPSYTTQDQKEMIRTLAAPHIDDGSDIIMDAEEYLQPRNTNNTTVEQTLSDGSNGESVATIRGFGSKRGRHFPSCLPYPSSLGLSSQSSRHSMMGSLASWGADGHHAPPDYKLLGASQNQLVQNGHHQRPPSRRRNSQDFFGKDPAMSSHFGSMIGIPIHESVGTASSFMSVPREVNSRTTTPVNLVYTNRAFGLSPHPETQNGPFGGSTQSNTLRPASKADVSAPSDNKGTFGNGPVQGPPLYRRRDAKVGEMKLKLPLDDNDYLMPSPQNSAGSKKPNSAQPRYPGDLGDQKSRMNSCASAPPSAGYNGQPLGFNVAAFMANRDPRTGLDNPEYHLMAQQLDQQRPTSSNHHSSLSNASSPSYLPHNFNSPSAFANGSPACSSFTGQSTASSGYASHPTVVAYQNVEAIATEAREKFRQQRSSEEESDDHEYYNEIDRLKCEMRPLQPNGGPRRNETTV